MLSLLVLISMLFEGVQLFPCNLFVIIPQLNHLNKGVIFLSLSPFSNQSLLVQSAQGLSFLLFFIFPLLVLLIGTFASFSFSQNPMHFESKRYLIPSVRRSDRCMMKHVFIPCDCHKLAKRVESNKIFMKKFELAILELKTDLRVISFQFNFFQTNKLTINIRNTW